MVSWGIGYGAMWGAKWGVADLLTDSNVILSAIEAIQFRTSSNLNEITFSYYDVLREQVKCCVQISWIFPTIVMCLLYIVKITKDKRIGLLPILYYGIVGMMPLCWYFIMKNHSYIHGRFTYRVLVISLYAVTMCLVLNIKDYKKCRKCE